ncbi:hypothetical protein ENBRE01_3446, partial [Enteropsectra breve]
MLGDVKLDFVKLLDFFRKFVEASREESGTENASNKVNTKDINNKEINNKFNINKDINSRSSGKTESDFGGKTTMKKGPEIIKEMERMGVDKDLFMSFKSALKAISDHEEAKNLINNSVFHTLGDIERVFEMLYAGCEAYAYCFQTFVRGDLHNGIKFSFGFWLLDPSVTFRAIASQVRSINLLSGTLTPFTSFNSELKYEFTHQIVAPSIVKAEQVFVSVVKRGHLGKELCGTYGNAETVVYLEQIANIIRDIAGKTEKSGGTLVFLPSYAFLAKLANKMPEAVVEPKAGGMAEFEAALKKYRAKIEAKKPSILLCVFRGKASEGI